MVMIRIAPARVTALILITPSHSFAYNWWACGTYEKTSGKLQENHKNLMRSVTTFLSPLSDATSQGEVC